MVDEGFGNWVMAKARFKKVLKEAVEEDIEALVVERAMDWLHQFCPDMSQVKTRMF